MTSPEAISDETRRTVEVSFPEQERTEVLNLLESLEWDHVRQFVLILAFGDLQALHKFVGLANSGDYRDLATYYYPSPWHDGPSFEEQARRRDALGLTSFRTMLERDTEIAAERLHAAVFGFVALELLFPTERLQLSTTLQQDIGLDGADGPRFINAFAERFNVNLEHFRDEVYFGPKQGDRPIADLLKLVFRRKDVPKRQITMADLMEAARQKKWSPLDPKACG